MPKFVWRRLAGEGSQRLLPGEERRTVHQWQNTRRLHGRGGTEAEVQRQSDTGGQHHEEQRTGVV